jgi:PIN domain nuclease of toxin-antitoxin system
LLDTHALLWCLAAPERLLPPVRAQIEDPDTTVYASAASAWEMEIKIALGKLEAPGDLADQLRLRRFIELPVHVRHVRALRALPALHRDPFDRLLVAQAIVDDLVIVTHDERIRRYPVRSIET